MSHIAELTVVKENRDASGVVLAHTGVVQGCLLELIETVDDSCHYTVTATDAGEELAQYVQVASFGSHVQRGHVLLSTDGWV